MAWKLMGIEIGNIDKINGVAVSDISKFDGYDVVYCLVNQNFEGTGYDNGESWLEWTGGTLTSGVLNANYTTALRGSQSLRIKDDASYGIAALTKFGDNTGYNALYGFFRFKLTDLPTGTSEVQTHYNAQGDVNEPDYIDYHEVISVTPSGSQYGWVVQNLTGVTGTTLYNVNTTYYVWWYIAHAADKTSSGWIKISASQAIPETNEVEWSGKAVYDAVNGSPMVYRGTNTVGFTSQHGNSYDYTVDQAIVSESEIGNYAF